MNQEGPTSPETPPASNIAAPPRLVSLRRSLFLRFGLVGACAVLLFAICYMQFGVRPLALQIADNDFTSATDTVANTLSRIFHPAENLSKISIQWVGPAGLDIDRPEPFNRLMQPILETMPQITSAVAGTTDGQGWLLLQLSDDRWRNRITDIPARGAQNLFIDWRQGEEPKRHFETIDYDPRLRPWFQNAMAAPANGAVHWSSPYTFFTTKDPGMTVSIRRDLEDGRSLVIGFDLKLIDISQTTAGITVGTHGYVVVLTDDDRVLGLPRPPAGMDLETERQLLLQPSGKLGLPAVNVGLSDWRQSRHSFSKTSHFTAKGEEWMATMRPFKLGQETFWIAAFAPQSDFLPSWTTMWQVLAFVLTLILGMTLLVARGQARNISTPLEELAAESERIAHLDFEDRPTVVSHWSEVETLASAQSDMRQMLREFRITVEAQEADLKKQVASLQVKKAELRTSQAQLQEALRQEQAILNNALTGIFFVRNRIIIRHNLRFAQMLGFFPGELNGRSTETIYENPEVFQTVGERAYSALRRDESFTEEMWFRRKDGIQFWGHLSGHALDASQPQNGSVWILVDLTERKRAEEQLVHMGNHDTLTGLPNRQLFNDRLSHALLRAGKNSDQLALLFVDLDHFKTINDTLGHEVGDQLLRVVSDRLKPSLGAFDTLARWGGDEFIILVEGVENILSVDEMAGHLLKLLSEPIRIGVEEFFISGSIGISMFPGDGEDTATLIRNADTAMYQAKAQGRNTFHFYSADMTRKTKQRMEIKTRLQTALSSGGLEVHFQPQVNLKNGRVSGVEALVRLRGQDGTLIPPNEFIPIAEESDLICQVGEWVLEQSCRLWVDLDREGLQVPCMAVNFSVKQLQRRNFLERVMDIQSFTGMPPTALDMEITESFFLESDGALDLMQRLAAVGVTFSLDDFGTGYSSLSYLKKLPFGKLKIDRAFVRGIGHSNDDEALVRTIISLARTLGLEVIAEGVETSEQAEFLVAAGCELAQGFLFARPMPIEAFRSWLTDRQQEHSPASTLSIPSSDHSST